ncbi:AraC family transcriptional regulator [Pseudoalteromonas sp. SMS1]|uniref:helix-turn-helix transcriptional regulator n=1 Tax=Pseudoalteromonas sp. SMS1 TaxID=2908894 RepID=UPI001F4232EE|nr:AraC family transcriptional regulator [Pseudoalteromonas sp. SMS1]MCF2859187.1 AraC family transcriptional regulator [Pseudoalteromonas sp. SMS1]
MMRSALQFYCYDSQQRSDCGSVLDIEFSNDGLDWPGIVLEKGSSPHFYPQHVYTPYFYFALALEKDLNWQVHTDEGITALKTVPGNIWINPPKTPFTHNISEPCFFVILAIEEALFLDSCPLDLKGKSLQFLNNYNVQDDAIKSVMELFILEAKNKGRNGKPFIHNLVSLLSNHYINNYSNYQDLINQKKHASKLDTYQIEKVDKFITENISNTIMVDDLAELVGCSKYYFLREFKKRMDITPYQYLLNHRLHRAKALLMQPSAHIADIAEQLGFNDQSHFTRIFKANVGCTPGQFVKNHVSK